MSLDFALPSGVKAEEERDSVGSSGPLESNVYDGVIEMIYLDESANGAKSYNIIFKQGTRTVRQTIYFTNRAGEFTYQCKREHIPKPLPGYSQLCATIEAITGKPLTEQDTETKSIKLMDWAQGREVPVERVVFMDTVGIAVQAAIMKVSEEKSTKESNYKDGTGEFRELNEFDKFFDEEGVSNVERKAGKTEPGFKNTWLKKNEGTIKIRKAKNPGKVQAAATSGAPALGGITPPASGMFS